MAMTACEAVGLQKSLPDGSRGKEQLPRHTLGGGASAAKGFD
jgi:hypothetical protein